MRPSDSIGFFEQISKPAFWLLLIAAMLFFVLGYGWMALDTTFPGMISDAVVYLFQADFFTERPPSRAASSFVFGYNYPPLFALWIALFGGGADAVERAALATAFSFYLCVPALVFLGVRMGLELAAAMFTALLFVLLPEVFLFSRNVLSEGLFTALCAVALAVMIARPARLEHLRLASFLVMLAILTRSAGIVLLAPLALVFWRLRRLDVAALAVLIVPLVSWSIFHSLSASADREPYSAALGTVSFATIVANLANYIDRWHAIWAGVAGAAAGLLLAWFVALAAAWWVINGLRRADPVAVFVAGYVGLFVIWPYPTHTTRFLIPLLPFLMLCAATIVTTKVRRGHPAMAAGAMGLLLASTVAASTIGQRARDGLPAHLDRGVSRSEPYLRLPTLKERQWFAEFLTAMSDVATRSATTVGVDECVVTPVVEHYFLYARRTAYRVVGEHDWARPGSFMGRCRYVFAIGTQTDRGADRFFPLNRRPEAFEILDRGISSEGVEFARLARLSVE